MTAGDDAVVVRYGADLECAAVARELVAAMTLTPDGHSSPSVYETARLVSLAPWLVRHDERIRYLLAEQRADGAWGGPGGYAVVPTLSATEALLATLHRGDPAGSPPGSLRDRSVVAVDRGLRTLFAWLTEPDDLVLPDLPATDLIVPALVEQLNEHLARLDAQPLSGLDRWRGVRPLPLPAGMGRDRLDRVRDVLASGHPIPQKLLHALEVGGGLVRRLPRATPTDVGTVGASPAATAAWLGEPGAASREAAALRYLEAVARQQGGPVPCASPIAVFERAWVLSTLSRAGIPLAVPAKLVAGLRTALGPSGTPTGPGLPADADTTSVTLYALARLGHPVEPSSLWGYDTGEHFCTWQGEDGASVTTNAHVLDALGWHLAHGAAAARPRLATAVGRLTDWLRSQQRADGRWSDRWHASPYYATCCAALALGAYGTRDGGAAVDRAVDWVVATQHADGSWGRWGGTVEETAYALHVLLAAGHTGRSGVRFAAARGHRFLAMMDGRDEGSPLWHDKDLYRPTLIVQAAVVAARHLAYGGGGAVTVDPATSMIRIA